MSIQIEEWRAADGWMLRTGHSPPAAPPRGTIVFFNGRADFIEKYALTYDEFNAWGYHVATWDWRGQGGSGRMTRDPHKGHQTDFGIWVSDALAWLESLRDRLPKPWYMVGHSMGGHLALRVLHDGGGWFERGVLLSPLLRLATPPLPNGAVRWLAASAVRAGKAQFYAPGQTGYGPLQRAAVRFGRLTSDRALFDEEHDVLADNPALALGGATYGWVHACFQSLDLMMAPGWPEAVTTPTLVLMPEKEMVVSTIGCQAFVDRMPNSSYEVVSGALHEMIRERATIREAVFRRIRQHLENHALPGTSVAGDHTAP